MDPSRLNFELSEGDNTSIRITPSTDLLDKVQVGWSRQLTLRMPVVRTMVHITLSSASLCGLAFALVPGSATHRSRGEIPRIRENIVSALIKTTALMTKTLLTVLRLWVDSRLVSLRFPPPLRMVPFHRIYKYKIRWKRIRRNQKTFRTTRNASFLRKLGMLGDRIMPDRVLEPAIHKDLAVRWADIIKNGLPVEERKMLLKKFLPPENCTVIDPPKLNLEVKSTLDSTVLKRDERITDKQTKIAAAIAGITKSLKLTLKGDPENKLGLVEHLIGVARLLVDLQRDETLVRRSLILKNIKPIFRDALKNTPCDEELFEKGLAEKLKTAKVLQQSSKDLKITSKGQTENKNPKNV
ncbi:hypothetical protein DMN91_010982 [Ooceraea biroi]|uniref:Uncharacterized protein n=1 Tax=Ooceraea biroi TaxID=2015173 RepID=A0A3L8D9X3_OOCBI|nr:hypothetical protein DMN91_010982 [Ooceraea biroi]